MVGWPDQTVLRRRHMLGGLGFLLGGGLPLRIAHAIGARSAVRIGRLNIPGADPRPRTTALVRLAWELEKRTAIVPEEKTLPVALSQRSLFSTPFLLLTGDRDFSPPSDSEVARLRRFLSTGGFLWIDSAEGALRGAFDRSVRRLLSRVFPGPESLRVLPRDHVLFKSFYLLDRASGRVSLTGAVEGVIEKKRLLVAYNQNDALGALARDPTTGNAIYPCEPGGEWQRELAIRFAVNVVMYALCLDYKSDQVHVPFIMRRRRWRIDEESMR